MTKRGQLQINFGMIFSIILIIAFLSVAIYAIIMFIDLKSCAETGMFKEDLQERITGAWVSDDTNELFEKTLPAEVSYVCIFDLNSDAAGKDKEKFKDFKRIGDSNLEAEMNMYFWPASSACNGQKGFKIEHLNVFNITSLENPKCFQNSKGKVKFRIIKKFYDPLIMLEDE